jgi:hypothetical protein
VDAKILWLRLRRTTWNENRIVSEWARGSGHTLTVWLGLSGSGWLSRSSRCFGSGSGCRGFGRGGGLGGFGLSGSGSCCRKSKKKSRARIEIRRNIPSAAGLGSSAFGASAGAGSAGFVSAGAASVAGVASAAGAASAAGFVSVAAAGAGSGAGSGAAGVVSVGLISSVFVGSAGFVSAGVSSAFFLSFLLKIPLKVFLSKSRASGAVPEEEDRLLARLVRLACSFKVRLTSF